MRIFFIFNLLWLNIFFAFAESPNYCFLMEDAVKWEIIKATNGNDSIINAYITTNCLVLKEGIWDNYEFESKISLLNLANRNAKTTLFINNSPYTGFVKIKEGENVTIYQFDKGKYERVDMNLSTITPPSINLVEELTEAQKDSIKVMPVIKVQEVRMLGKPILYLYPTDKQEVIVKLKLNGQQLISPYPKYDPQNGWKVSAFPNGNLINESTGKSHYCLYWESEGKPLLKNIQQGFVVKKEECAAFLEEKLALLGLNEREANEFIIYWLPQLEANPYNAIYFATSEYEKVVQLDITPTPETQIRVMMVWEGLQEKIYLPTQILPQTPERKGFTVVEWGGTNISKEVFVNTK